MSSIKYSHTLWSPSDTVRDVAEVLGISNLPEEALKTLAMDVEYRIREIVEQAMKFMRHSKRTILTTGDISHALRVLNVEPMYGYQTQRSLSYREALVGPGQTLYYVDEDEDVDFEKIINQPLPKVPRAVTFTAHWLAIEGVQPAIAQNPHNSEIKAMPTQLRGSQQTYSVSSLTPDVDVKPLVKHVISKELHLYFDRVVAALQSTNKNDDLKRSALGSLRSDPGLHQIVPYFVQFVQEKISQTLKFDLNVVSTMLDVTDALLSNPTIFIEPYIHHIIPSILTPLLAKRIGPKVPGSDSEFSEEPYAVRDYAASLLQKICATYGSSYHTLKPRVTRTLLKGFMDTSRPAGAAYGAILGLKALGPEVVRVIVLGNVKIWSEGIMSKFQDERDSERVLKALTSALASLASQAPATDVPVDEDLLKEKLGTTLAESILALPDAQAVGTSILME